MDSPREVPVRRENLIQVLRELETIVVSLDHVGPAMSDRDKGEQAMLLLRFVEDWNVFGRRAASGELPPRLATGRGSGRHRLRRRP